MSAFSALSGPVPCVSPSFPFSTFPSTKNGSPPPRWQEEGSGTSERILPGWLLAPVSTKHTEGEKREDRPLPQPRLQLRRMHAFYVLERATLEYHLTLTEGDLTFTPTVEDPMVFMVTKHTSVFSNHDKKVVKILAVHWTTQLLKGEVHLLLHLDIIWTVCMAMYL